MAEALVSALIENLVSLAFQRIEKEVSLVQGVEEDVRWLKRNLEAIQDVLEDAEKRQLADLSVRNWLDQLKDVTFDMDDVLDEWSTAILKLKIETEVASGSVEMNNKKVCFFIPSAFSCFKSKVNRITLRHDIAHKIKDLNGKLDAIAVEKDRYKLNTAPVEQPAEQQKTISFVDETEIHGRDNDVNVLLSKLLSEDNTSQAGKGLDIIPIVGMGGLGKTTLAQLVYKNKKVLTHFDKKIWVCVSDPFDEIKVAKAIIAEVEGNAPDVNELETLLQKVRKCLEGKRFLLVLDDVWTKESKKWEQLKQPLKYGAIGSKIVVTTRKEEVAIMMGAANCTISLEKLSEEHCWLIFQQLAFSERKKEDCTPLEEIGRKIASESKGLPLVAKILGSLMRFKISKTQWENVLHSELWKTKDVEIFAPFFLSYHDLSPKEKRCFSYCSIFPKDHEIRKDELIRMWMAQGYISSDISSEEEGHECFQNLVMRSFFQNIRKDWRDNILYCQMHDIVHDFAQFLTKNECITMEVGSVEEELKPLNENARHLTLDVGSGTEFPALNYNRLNKKNLRTLFIVSNNPKCSVDSSMFVPLTCLRTLSIVDCGLKTLPESINRLIHLRHLNLAKNKLEELPDTLCDLCNLQTLDLRMCYSIRRLPEGIGKLINLKHLYLFSCGELEGLPKGISRLPCLRKLDTLVVPEHKEAYFDIGDLKRLKNLRLDGDLNVYGCRKLGNAAEAEKIGLKNSQDCHSLHIDFGKLKRQSTGFEGDSAILEALEPHQNLKRLIIENYTGPKVSPRWMLSLNNLRAVYIWDCENCEILPSLGQLQFLEKFRVIGLKSVKMVGVEFLGITKRDEEDGATSRGDQLESPDPIISFPKLNTLEFAVLFQWEKWEASEAEKETTGVIVMPCLSRLRIWRCPRLQALPDFLQTMTSLKELEIYSSEILEECCKKRIGKEWGKISHIPNIKVNDVYVQIDGIYIQGDHDVPGTSSSSSSPAS